MIIFSYFIYCQRLKQKKVIYFLFSKVEKESYKQTVMFDCSYFQRKKKKIYITLVYKKN